MNVKVAIGMLMSVSGAVFGQITMSTVPPDLMETNPPSWSPTNSPASPSLGMTNNLPPLGLNQTNQLPNIQLSPPEIPKSKQPTRNVFGLAPGVYITKPYSCMVMVPGAQPDDCSILPAQIPPHSIPNAKPKLKFDPLPPADGL